MGLENSQRKGDYLMNNFAKAREEGYLNTWGIQSLCRGFKFGYWEA